MEEADYLFIESIRNHENLYDKSRPDFKDKLKKENTWKTIAMEFGMTVENAMQKWQMAKDKYTKERKELNFVPSGSAAPTKTESELFKAMDFMRSHILYRKRQTKNNASTMNSSSIPTELAIEVQAGMKDNNLSAVSTNQTELYDNCEGDIYPTNIENTPENISDLSMITPSPSDPLKIFNKATKIKSKRKLEDDISKHMDTLNNYLLKNGGSSEGPSSFFIALSEEFNKVKKRKQKKIKMELMTLVLQNQSESDSD